MTAGPSENGVETSKTPEVGEFIPPAYDKQPEAQETEVTPLLGHTSNPLGEDSIGNGKPRMNSRTILIFMGLLVWVVQCGDQFQQSPITRILESIYCYEYWEKADPSKILVPRSSVRPGALGGVDERWCKIAEVQGKVAMLKGVSQFLDCIPSLILAIPIGILADRWGRKPFLILGLCAIPLSILWQQVVCWFWQSFDLRFFWFSSLYAVFGGGSPIISAILFVVISDVTTQENRSQIFLRIFSANLAPNFIVPPISAWIMTIDPWIAMFLSVACLLAAIPILAFIPETLGYQQSIVETSRERVDEESPTQTSADKVKNFMRRCYKPLQESTEYFLQDWRIIPLMVTFVLVMATSTITPLLLQYCSTRYSMPFSQATVVVSLRAGFTLIMFLFVQPWILQFLNKSGMNGRKVDLLLARGSAIFLLIGWVAVGLAPDAALFALALVVVTLGNGFPVFVRSFLTSLVDANKVAELYTTIGLVDTVGVMIVSPLFAWLFGNGLKVGGMAIGLPFWCLGLGYGGAVLLLFWVSHRKHAIATEEEQQDEE